MVVSNPPQPLVGYQNFQDWRDGRFGKRATECTVEAHAGNSIWEGYYATKLDATPTRVMQAAFDSEWATPGVAVGGLGFSMISAAYAFDYPSPYPSNQGGVALGYTGTKPGVDNQLGIGRKGNSQSLNSARYGTGYGTSGGVLLSRKKVNDSYRIYVDDVLTKTVTTGPVGATLETVPFPNRGLHTIRIVFDTNNLTFISDMVWFNGTETHDPVTGAAIPGKGTQHWDFAKSNTAVAQFGVTGGALSSNPPGAWAQWLNVIDADVVDAEWITNDSTGDGGFNFTVPEFVAYFDDFVTLVRKTTGKMMPIELHPPRPRHPGQRGFSAKPGGGRYVWDDFVLGLYEYAADVDWVVCQPVSQYLTEPLNPKTDIFMAPDSLHHSDLGYQKDVEILMNYKQGRTLDGDTPPSTNGGPTIVVNSRTAAVTAAVPLQVDLTITDPDGLGPLTALSGDNFLPALVPTGVANHFKFATPVTYDKLQEPDGSGPMGGIRFVAKDTLGNRTGTATLPMSVVAYAAPVGPTPVITVNSPAAGAQLTDTLAINLTIPDPSTVSLAGADLVAIGGQSNGQGAGIPYDPALDPTLAGLNQLPQVGAPIQAIDSLSHVTTWTNGATTPATPRVGPGMQFGRRLKTAQPANRTVLLVPVAQGTTGFVGGDPTNYSWDPSDTVAAKNLYTNAVAQIRRGLNLAAGNRLRAFIWAQGESDASKMTQAAYTAKMLQLIDGLRAEFGDFMFIIDGMVPEWIGNDAGRMGIDKAHKALVTLRDNVVFVPGVTGHNQDGLIHYNAAGARLMGDQAYEAYAAAAPTTGIDAEKVLLVTRVGAVETEQTKVPFTKAGNTFTASVALSAIPGADSWYARAQSTDGVTGVSAPRAFTRTAASDTVPPSVTWGGPADGLLSGTVPLRANAYDAGGLAYMEFRNEATGLPIKGTRILPADVIAGNTFGYDVLATDLPWDKDGLVQIRFYAYDKAGLMSRTGIHYYGLKAPFKDALQVDTDGNPVDKLFLAREADRINAIIDARKAAGTL